jgi:hypothetical protein
VAPVYALPLAILLRHLPPRRSRPRHSQEATEHSAMVVGRPACTAPLWGQQGTHQYPLLVGEPRLFGRDRRGLEGCLCVERSPGLAPRRLTCLAPASGHLLVSRLQKEATPGGSVFVPSSRPSRARAVWSRAPAGDQAKIEIPLLPGPSSCSTEERTTARKAWVSRQRVTWRCQPSHFPTS